MAGWFDLPHVINPFTTKEGMKLLSAEDDYGGKVDIYRWCPRGTCPDPEPARNCADSSVAHVRLVGRKLRVDAAPDLRWRLDVYSIRGQRSGVSPDSWMSGDWESSEVRTQGPLYARVTSECQGSERNTRSFALLGF